MHQLSVGYTFEARSRACHGVRNRLNGARAVIGCGRRVFSCILEASGSQRASTRRGASSDSIIEKSIDLAKTNFQYEKRQKDLEKKRKKEEKLKKKADKATQPDGTQVEGDETVENATHDPATENGVETAPTPANGESNQPV